MRNEFREVVEIMHQIKNTSGANDKQAILKANKNNDLLKSVLDFIYNPFVLTGIKGKKLMKFTKFTGDDVKQFNSVLDAMNYAKENNTGRDEDVKAIANFINTYDTDISSPVHDFLQDMFTKDFKCGATASTLNKVFGKGFIPKFDVMLAKGWEEEKHKVKGKFLITPKLDGIRCAVIKENGDLKFFTRKGMPIEGMVELEKDFKLLPDNMVYDGELLNVNKDGLDRLELFRATQSRVKKDGVKTDITFNMYEMLPLDEFKQGKSKKSAMERKQDIKTLIFSLAGELCFIKLVPVLYYGTDEGELMRLLKEALDDGEEGIMVSVADSKYECKRSGNLLKAKKIEDKTVDLVIVGFEEGTGKYKGMLGSLTVDYKGGKLGVGSGFTDLERKEFWKNRDDLLGTIVEVKYDDESQNEFGEDSLRYPIFVTLRDDKDEPSLY